MPDPILSIERLSKRYAVRGGAWSWLPGRRKDTLGAVIDVSFDVFPQETIGLVGESGCGKTTLGRLIVALERPDAGRILFRGEDIARRSGGDPRALRRRIQMVFQDPYSSLNPRLTVRSALAEPLAVHRIVEPGAVATRVDRLLDLVGLSARTGNRYPHELSGGQRQRVGIARALSVEPEILIADEAVSSLDVSIRAQILNLLQELRSELGLTMIFISHDLSVVEYLSDRVGVMYLGRLVEFGPGHELFRGAGHPYTRGLISAIPSPDPSVRRVSPAVRGEIPSPIHPPSGCVFRTRCPLAVPACSSMPPVVSLAADHWAACYFAGQVASQDGGPRMEPS